MQQATQKCAQSILLIDDDQLIAGSLRQYLLATGWVVEVGNDRVAAEDLLRARQYSVIVIDPYLTGTISEDRDLLMCTARRLQPEAALIVLTGYGSTDLQRAAADCRAAVLDKPQSVIALSEAIVAASRISLSLQEGQELQA